MTRPATSIRPHETAPVHPSGARLPLRTIVAYGGPSLGISAPFFLVQLYLMNFATDVLLIAPATMGAILALGRVWDAVTDPLAGTWSDRTRSRLGRRRPWLLVSAPILALSFAALWHAPKGAVLYVTVCVFAFFAASTAWIIPHIALGAELSDDHHERSRVFGARQLSFMAGIFVAFAGMQLIANAEDPHAMAGRMALAVAAFVAVAALLPGMFVRERPELASQSPPAPLRSMLDVLRGRDSRVLFAAWFIDQLGLSTTGILAPYLMIHVLQRPELIAVIPIAFFLPSLISIPIWVSLSRRIGKRRAWLASMWISALGYGPQVFVGPGDFVLIVPLLVLAGVGAGCAGTLGLSLLTDVIDEDEVRTGTRKEGSYSAAWLIAVKLAGAVIAGIVGVTLQLSGFDPEGEPSSAALWSLRGLVGLLPCAAFISGALVFRRYALDEETCAGIRVELDRRRRG